MKRNAAPSPEQIPEFCLVGDITDHEADMTEKILDVPWGGPCIIYFDSPGGSPYSALSLICLLRLRDIQATGIVTGECSSAALWPFAACRKRYVTPYSVLMFHPMKWQSEENVGITEAAEWARHFGKLEQDMDTLLAELFEVPLTRLQPWLRPGSYVTGSELAEARLAELIHLQPLAGLDPRRIGEKRRDAKRSPAAVR